MIPRTFPSSVADNGSTQMVVYFLPDVSGLVRWTDYIPVQYSTVNDDTTENTYNQDGYIPVVSVSSIEGTTPFKEYVPVFVDSSADPADVWKVNITGFIPVGTVGIGGTSLSLNFAAATSLDPRVTFSRTTNATLTNSAGLVANAPMNLLTFSEQFDNAAWGKTNATVTANSTTAPNGTTTADTISISGSTSNTAQAVTLGPGTYTFSVYVKTLTVTTPGVLRLLMVVDSTAQSVSFTPTEEWTRQTFTVTAATGITSVQAIRGLAYVGTVAIWGAQLELGSTATTYNPTTVKNLLGYTEHFDNAAWTKSNSFVQTNLLTFSEQFDNAAWAKTGATVAANATASPDRAVTADKLVSTATTGQHEAASSVPVTAGTVYSISVYAKKGEYDLLQITHGGSSANAFANYDLTTGTVIRTGGSGGAPIATSITDVGNGWYRCVLVDDASLSSSAGGPVITPLPSDLTTRRPSYDGDGTSGIYIWGAQLVQGTSAGDYKATYSDAAAVGYTDIYGQPFAQKLVPTVSATDARAQQSFTGTAGAIYTLTAYAKAGEFNGARLYADDGASNLASVFYNLTTGAVNSGPSTSGTWTGVSTTSTDVGNGWWRISLTWTATGAAPTRYQVRCTNIGDGTSGIYIFGAQLSDSASVDPYVYQPVAAPTSTAYYGPRFDYDASTATITENYGPELVVNGDFSDGTTTGWTSGSAASTASVVAGEMQVTSVSASGRQVTAISTVIGTTYKVYGVGRVISGSGSPGATLYLTSSTGTTIIGGNINYTTSNEPLGLVFTATATTSYIAAIAIGNIGAVSAFDNITVKEYLGITSTGATPKGLLIEEQRTNLLTYSEQFDDAVWSKSNAAVVANITSAPNGTLTADKLVENTANGVHRTNQLIALAASTTYVYSFYAKSSGRSNLVVGRSSSTFINSFEHFFDLTLGTASGGGVITAIGNDWFQCSGSFSTTATAGTAGVLISLSDGSSVVYTGDGTSGVFLWGAQLEAGAFATSYIPTVASQVTRAADNASMIGNNFARWYNVNEGTLYVEAQPADRPDLDSSTNGVTLTAASFGDALTNQYSVLTRTEAGSRVNRAAAYFRSPTISSGIETPGNDTYPNGVFTKFATAMKAFDYAFSANGGAIVASAVPDAVIGTRLNIGANYNFVTLNGHISRISYFNRRLADSELIGITS